MCALVYPDSWISTTEWSTTGFAGAVGFGDTGHSRIKDGDKIEISGKVKFVRQNSSVRLSHVKRLDYVFAKEASEIRAVYTNAVKQLPADLKFPAPIPHVYSFVTTGANGEQVPPQPQPICEAPAPVGCEWSTFGGPDGLHGFRCTMKDKYAFTVAAANGRFTAAQVNDVSL